MKLFSEKRFIFQQQPTVPAEIQSQPPVETGKETVAPGIETGKEALPSSAETVSNEYKEKGKQKITTATNNLSLLQNLKVE